jgi:hypothetical protein
VSGQKISMVDGNAIIVKPLELKLQAAGEKVLSVLDGRTAIRRVRCAHRRLNLLASPVRAEQFPGSTVKR